MSKVKTAVGTPDPDEPLAQWEIDLLVDQGSPRALMLNKAKGLITGDRNNHYGPPTQDFAKSAGILKALGYKGPDGREILPHDIAIMAMAIKLSRITWSPDKEDHWVDLAGYAACAYECVTVEQEGGEL